LNINAGTRLGVESTAQSVVDLDKHLASKLVKLEYAGSSASEHLTRHTTAEGLGGSTVAKIHSVLESDWPEIVGHLGLLQESAGGVEDRLDRALSNAVALMRVWGRCSRSGLQRRQVRRHLGGEKHSLGVAVENGSLAKHDGLARQAGEARDDGLERLHELVLGAHMLGSDHASGLVNNNKSVLGTVVGRLQWPLDVAVENLAGLHITTRS
jgi:hypothetical protein